jgi:N-acetylglutamate synthase-like GNAT family acetyltransferase
MKYREVNTLKLEEYIRGAWEGDSELEKFYDRSLQMRNLEGMVRDTSRKIRDMMELDEKLSLIGIEFENKSVGFIVLSEKLSMLYSFGVNVEYRKKDILISIFNYIKAKLKYEFYSVMYVYNTRAIKWLQNCGFEVDPMNKPSHDTIYLKYDICQ